MLLGGAEYPVVTNGSCAVCKYASDAWLGHTEAPGGCTNLQRDSSCRMHSEAIPWVIAYSQSVEDSDWCTPNY